MGLSAESVVEPPARTFRYRLKPVRSGVQTVGPILVSSLDPVSSTYRTTATKAITVRVIDVPNFDTAILPSVDVSDRVPGLTIMATLGLLFALSLIGLAKFRHAQRSRLRPSRLAAELVAGIEQTRILDHDPVRVDSDAK